jgi:hypothetical protein
MRGFVPNKGEMGGGILGVCKNPQEQGSEEFGPFIFQAQRVAGKWEEKIIESCDGGAYVSNTKWCQIKAGNGTDIRTSPLIPRDSNNRGTMY